MFLDYLDFMKKTNKDITKFKIDSSNLTREETNMFKDELQRYLQIHYGKKTDKYVYEK